MNCVLLVSLLRLCRAYQAMVFLSLLDTSSMGK